MELAGGDSSETGSVTDEGKQIDDRCLCQPHPGRKDRKQQQHVRGNEEESHLSI